MTTDRLIFERDAADWPLIEASQRVDAGGLRWHVQRLGQGPPLLLLHGTAASTHSWAPAARHLCDRFTVLVPDLPGHAFTEAPSQTMLSLPGMAWALAALLEKLGVEPLMCAGHSAGAAILIRMALDGAIRPASIVSFNGAILPLHGLAGQIFSPLAKLLVLNPFAPSIFAWRAGHAGAVAKVLRGTGSDVPEESIRIYERLFQCRAHVATTLRMMALWDLEQLKADLPRLPTHLHLVAGARDRAISPRFSIETAKMVKRAKVIEMPETGHLSHEEAPLDAARIIVEAAQEMGVLAPSN